MTPKAKKAMAELSLSRQVLELGLECPVCPNQELSCDGDEPEFIFCPHCELEVTISVKLSWREHRHNVPISRAVPPSCAELVVPKNFEPKKE